MTHRVHVQTMLWTVALIALLMWWSVPASAGNNSNPSGVQHDLLFVSPGPDGDQFCVEKRTDGNNRKIVRKDKSPYKAIKWAIKRGRITTILKGDYHLDRIIKIKQDEETLIVAPDAKLAYKSDKPTRPSVPIIEVLRADDVRIFTFGLFEQTGTTQEPLAFTGYRKDGKSGIDGGFLFGTSTFRNMGSAYTITGSEDIHIPLAMGSNYGQMLVGCGGDYNISFGTLVGLGTSKGDREGELIDMNAFNKNITIDRVIGTSPMEGDEIVDINHSHNVTINRFQAFLGTDRPGRLPVGLDLYGSPGYNDWSNRAKLLGGGFQKSKHIRVKHMERVRKKVEGFDRKVTLPGFPEALPELTIKVHLTVNFEDGTSRTLIDKNYRYDLNSRDF